MRSHGQLHLDLRFPLRSKDFLLPVSYVFKVEEEERRLEAAIEEAEKQCAAVNNELKELDSKSKRFKELEER